MDKQEKKGVTTSKHTCPWWLLFTFDNPLRRLIHNPIKLLAPYVSAGDTVLDVGCGRGGFSIDMAQLVGQEGRVICADVQEEMLAGLQQRAARAGLTDRIQLRQSTPDHIGLVEPLDFALAFWMVHEVRRPELFLSEIYEHLQPHGRFLIVEPRIHVSAAAFRHTVTLAENAGFRPVDSPRVRLSRSLLLEK